MRVVSPDHPDPNVLAAFIDGRLEDQQIPIVTRHLDECSDCLEVVGAAAEIGQDIPLPAPLAARARFRPLTAVLAAAAAIALFIGGLAVWKARYSDPVRPIARAMAGVSERPVEARLDGFPWAPHVVRRSAGSLDPDLPLLEARAAAADVLEATRHGERAREQHAAGIAALISGDVPSAVEHLTRAAEMEPASGRWWSDLAAALYEQADRLGDPLAIERALAAVDHALLADPSHPAALFNRALILELAGRRSEALAAWQRVTATEPESAWAAEAARRAARLRELG